MSTCLRKLPQHERQWVTKTASENCGVGTTLVHWNMQEDAICPRCNHPNETTEHVSQCQGQGASKTFRKSLRRIRKHLTEEKTHPQIQRAILHCLRRWHKGRQIDMPRFPESIQQAINHQSTIGWQDFLEGLMAKQWQVLQAQHYASKRSRKTSKKWATGVITQVIRLGIRQWRHRNDYKHRLGKPREAEYERILNHAIARELILGPATLLPGDRHKVQINLIRLLKKPLRTRKAWWINVHTARQRFLQIQAHDDELERQSKESSTLYQWLEKPTR
jgi:hypothetical protein